MSAAFRWFDIRLAVPMTPLEAAKALVPDLQEGHLGAALERGTAEGTWEYEDGVGVAALLAPGRRLVPR